MASLVCNLIEFKRIKTTVPKAKEARSLADRVVTLGKRGTVAARRQVVAALRQKKHVAKLFDEIVPHCMDRNSGYTRMLKVGARAGDAGDMAILEWVSISAPPKKKPSKKDKDDAKK